MTNGLDGKGRGAYLLAMRLLRIVLIGAGLAVVQEVARTTPYLGLPFEPKPVFLDCYPQAVWNGKVYIPTGRTICLGGSTASGRP